MVRTMKRFIAAFLSAALAASIIFAFPFIAYGAEKETYQGTYEGEYDANGKRNDQGTWAYHNYLYVGHWENDMPNGEGTLYYGVVAIETGEGAIMRADLDGGNPRVLGDGLEAGHSKSSSGFNWTGYLNSILVAGDWMLIHQWNQWSKEPDTDYLMKLDGGSLHRVDEFFVPEDAPSSRMPPASGGMRCLRTAAR